jgi:hypothetical protein
MHSFAQMLMVGIKTPVNAARHMRCNRTSSFYQILRVSQFLLVEVHIPLRRRDSWK